MLRFDVETIYKATLKIEKVNQNQLRFDVETIYKATYNDKNKDAHSCGLM